MTNDKNEWDLFASVHRSLMAGAQLVTVRQHIPYLERPEDGNYGLATDEAGEEYELTSAFTAVLLTCIREYRISWSFRQENSYLNVYQFGPDVKKATLAAEDEPGEEGLTTIDLLALDPNDPATHEIFKDVQKALDGDSAEDEGEEWKRLLNN